LILSKVEIREGEAFPFPVSFSATEVMERASSVAAVYAERVGLDTGSTLFHW